jgi:hypothetical protein
MHNSSIVENGTLAKKLAKQIVVVGKRKEWHISKPIC